MSVGAPRSVPVVVGCSDRKRGLASESCLLRNHLSDDPSGRLRTWIAALGDSPTTIASDLYLGEQWTVVRYLQRARPEVDLWVASAGYGLIPHHAWVRPYGATFAGGHPDSVDRSQWSEDLAGKAWWEGLREWEGPAAGNSRSLAGLADQSDGMIVALSPPYLRAVQTDLLHALKVLGSRLLVVSAGTRPDQTPLPLLPVTGQLRTVVGGSMQSVSARAVGLILERIDVDRLDRPLAARMLGELLQAAPALPRYERTPLTDKEVLDFIQIELKADSSASCSLLHRSLRRGGRACEQRRFRRLYDQVKESHV
jgi:hypothetical protein